MNPRSEPVLRIELQPGRDGAHHMQRDAALLAAQSEHHDPVLRLYTWSPPAVSFGYMQQAADLLDLDACRAAGVDVVRRPTGGRAILHWEEITYAIVASTTDARFGANLAASHARIGACLAAGLRHLGVEAELSRPMLDAERRWLRQPCFASPGRAELMVAGRKLLGSAQRRNPTAFLQHGSLLVGPAHVRLVELLQDARRDPGVGKVMRDKLQRDTVTLQDLLGSMPPFEVLAPALIAGFATELQLETAPLESRPVTS